MIKIIALSHSSVYISLLTSRGGMDEFVIGIMKKLSVDHQSLEERERVCSRFKFVCNFAIV